MSVTAAFVYQERRRRFGLERPMAAKVLHVGECRESAEHLRDADDLLR